MVTNSKSSRLSQGAERKYIEDIEGLFDYWEKIEGLGILKIPWKI